MTVAVDAYWFPVGGDERPVLRNVGTISAAGGTLDFGFDNDGTVSGPVSLGNGEWDVVGRSTGRYGAGVAFTAGVHRLGSGAGFDGAVIRGGRVEVLGAGSGPGTLTVAGGTLAGDGALAQAGGFELRGGTVAGSVSVTTGAGASNVVESGAVQGSSVVDLSGSTSAPAGAVVGYDSARIVNRGAMTVAVDAYWFPVGGDERPVLRNVGTISAAGGTLGLGFDNDGTVSGPVSLGNGEWDVVGRSTGRYGAGVAFTAGVHRPRERRRLRWRSDAGRQGGGPGRGQRSGHAHGGRGNARGRRCAGPGRWLRAAGRDGRGIPCR